MLRLLSDDEKTAIWIVFTMISRKGLDQTNMTFVWSHSAHHQDVYSSSVVSFQHGRIWFYFMEPIDVMERMYHKTFGLIRARQQQFPHIVFRIGKVKITRQVRKIYELKPTGTANIFVVEAYSGEIFRWRDVVILDY